MELKWEREDTELLISLIEQHPCLYDIRDNGYLNRAKRTQAFNNILEVMWNNMEDISLPDIKRRWKSIRSQYTYEQRILSKSKKSGSVYIPKLWCFSQLLFLESNTKIKQSGGNVKENDEENINCVQTDTENESLIEEPTQQNKRVIPAKQIRSNQKHNKTEYDCLKLEDMKCRICFQEDVKVDWNNNLRDNDQLTYKDCYYKYTQLECFDEDNIQLSGMLCRSCSNSLENIDEFITKAIENHNFLKKDLPLNTEPTDFETILMPETVTDISKPEMQNVLMYEDTSNEYLKESDSWSMTEAIKPRRSERKKKKGCKIENAEASSDEWQSDKPNLKRNRSKSLKVPTCCSICSKVFASKYKAIQHEKTHYKNRERNQICSKCGMKFYDKLILKSHMLTHDENREKAHKCEFCDKAFYNSGGLNIHRRIHLGQMIPCSLCSKEYYRQIDLDKHMISHSARTNGEVKPKKKYFVHCDICNVTVRSVQYKSHYARHMSEPLAKCAICEKEFYSRKSCITHLKKVHNKVIGEMNNFIIAFKKSRYSNLFLRQKIGNIFTIE